MRLIASWSDVTMDGIARVQSSLIAAEVILCGAIARIWRTRLRQQSLAVLGGKSGLHGYLVGSLRSSQRILVVLHEGLACMRHKIRALTDHTLSSRSCRARWHEVLRPSWPMLDAVGRDLVLLHRRLL